MICTRYPEGPCYSYLICFPVKTAYAPPQELPGRCSSHGLGVKLLLASEQIHLLGVVFLGDAPSTSPSLLFCQIRRVILKSPLTSALALPHPPPLAFYSAKSEDRLNDFQLPAPSHPLSPALVMKPFVLPNPKIDSIDFQLFAASRPSPPPPLGDEAIVRSFTLPPSTSPRPHCLTLPSSPSPPWRHPIHLPSPFHTHLFPSQLSSVPDIL